MNIMDKGVCIKMECVWILSEVLTYMTKFTISFLIFLKNVWIDHLKSSVFCSQIWSLVHFFLSSWLFFRFSAVLKLCFSRADACLVIFFFPFANNICAMVCVHADITHSCFIALVSMPRAMHHSRSDPIPTPCPRRTHSELIEWVILR